MADLTIDWSELGPYGTQIQDTDTTGGTSATIDAGGVAVDITFDGMNAGDLAYTYNNFGYVAPSDSFDPQSWLKLYGGVDSIANTTSTTLIDFRSTDAAYTDSVQNVTFRLNEVDTDTSGDLGISTTPFEDIVTINAYDLDGNPVAVTITPAGAASVSGNTATGTTSTDLQDPDGSVLVEIAGPLSSIEIVYANGGTGDQRVTISDIDFETVDTDPDANDAPVAVADTTVTDMDAAVAIDAAANDTDPDGDPLTVTGIGTVTNGTATIDPVTNEVIFTPTPGFTGTGTVEYTVSDPDGASDTGLITITVGGGTGGNTDPDAVDDFVSTPIDTARFIDALANDTDLDGDTLSVTAINLVTNGSAGIDPVTGQVIFVPAPGFTGTATIGYTVSDGNGGTDTATIYIDVAAGNLDPEANLDLATTDVGVPVSIDALANDTDPNGDPLTITSLGAVTNGTAAIDPVSGEVVFTPTAGFIGTGTVEYTIDDGNGGTDTGLIEIQVGTTTPGNTDPVANPDTATTPVDVPVSIDVLGNDTDADGDPLTVTGIGTVTNGTAAIDPVTGEVIFTPTPGFTGTGTVEYTISDGNGGTDTATATIDVGGTNSDPEANTDVAETAPGVPVTITPLANDTDPDGDPLTLTSVSTPSNGTVSFDPTTGEVIYTPDPDFIGLETLTYTIEDGNGGTDTGTILIGSGFDPVGRIDTDIFPVSPANQPLDPFNTFDEDADPEDDRDGVSGDAGDNLISTGDDRDTISAGGGNDTVYSGIDDDVVTLGGGDDLVVDIQGADTILGGTGNDTIIAGFDTYSDYDDDDAQFADGTLYKDTFGFDFDPNQEDGRDSVRGQVGDDSISTGDDRDTIFGGSGNDTIFGGIDDDYIEGNLDDDSLFGGHGADTIDGGAGNDYIDGNHDAGTRWASLEQTDDVDVNTENDRDFLFGALGDDTIFGGDDDDTLQGGSGNDYLDGGIDEDLITGGADDDTLIGGQGSDTLNGGAGVDSIEGGEGRDTIIVSSAAEGTGDYVDGGSEGFVDTPDPSDPANLDYDVLDLSGVGQRDVDWRIVNEVADSNGNGIDGTVEFLDGSGAVTGTMDFFEIEEIVPCFTPGTLIATPQGERLVEDLKVGDRVITRDNGIQEIKWVGRKDLTGHELARKPHLNPILITQGALGNGLPEQDMLVSPNHRVLVANDKTALYFEEREVLVAAKHLLGLEGVEEVTVGSVAYIHIMFDTHEVVLSNGAWTESFQPGDYSLKGIGNAQRQEILELFPELAEEEGLKAYVSARRSLKKHEAALLTK